MPCPFLAEVQITGTAFPAAQASASDDLHSSSVISSSENSFSSIVLSMPARSSSISSLSEAVRARTSHSGSPSVKTLFILTALPPVSFLRSAMTADTSLPARSTLLMTAATGMPVFSAAFQSTSV